MDRMAKRAEEGGNGRDEGRSLRLSPGLGLLYLPHTHAPPLRTARRTPAAANLPPALPVIPHVRIHCSAAAASPTACGADAAHTRLRHFGLYGYHPGDLPYPHTVQLLTTTPSTCERTAHAHLPQSAQLTNRLAYHLARSTGSTQR